MLLVDSAQLLELEPERLPEVDRVAFPAYVEGLRAAGWDGGSRLARLGYCVSAALFPGMVGPQLAIHFSQEDMQTYDYQIYGCYFEELALKWRIMQEYVLSLGEEALSLMTLAA